ncbi:hypothetical protein GCM10011514_06110 [Emticicia aquatilis]|uniref:Uncharacterized protein n=1 Tax=Emticicia aquatilis TaxID=1537369 RepID=A0A916YGT9_9BACT|nr:hypothetical protein [Emticicia aquatilis]GGD44878.1 hypothetical protein GCM10011514_06110 [Emticicia aquatilis]
MSKKFEVLELADNPKQHSEIAVGGIYWGELDEQEKRIFYTDCVGTDWVFYINDTCKLV